MNKLLWLLCILSFGTFMQVNARSSFSGKIINENKVPLENVFVRNLINGTHTHSDRNGMFVLENTSESDSLEISHPGYDVLYYVMDIYDNVSIQLTGRYMQKKISDIGGKEKMTFRV